ncbi:hypothetical protein BLNAU_4154 [Blattamonas nauphoetae]|uniref:Protein kinase domain-containing protein n=1 Tax=Blattamonas nauphoetae TaxID=2049346 RepID=A0ABQ9YAK8_9EUKA|nr:hypothetical protein BLNAU_4154 [Blattamonas nauphoetae]
MGTGLCGTRLGGNIVCVNSSFSSCVRTSNAVIDHQHINITQDVTGRTFVEAPETTSVKFTLCTFNDMTVAAGNNEGGAAISMIYSRSSLTVTQCFFHKCSCTAAEDDGGAICLRDNCLDYPVSLSLSSFTECENTGTSLNLGGCVNFYTNSTISISDCFFEKSKSQYAGAVCLWCPQLATLSNCAFVECSSRTWGGAMGLIYIESIALFFLQFRGCSGTSSPFTNDIYFYGISRSLANSDTIRFCDSTSGIPNVHFDTKPNDMSYLVPQLQSTPKVTVSVSFSGEKAIVIATMSEGVNGTMGILLNGSNVPRLVHVQLGNDSRSSKSGFALVSSGDGGVLPQAEYSLRAWSLATTCFIPPSVHAVHASLKEGNTTDIVLHGVNLGEGSYSMLIRNGGNTFNISLTRSDSTTLVGDAPLYPSTDTGRLERATEYEVEKVMWLAQGVEEDVRLTQSIAFTTPDEIPCLTSCLDISLNGRKDGLTMTFQASGLPVGTGTIQLKATDSDMLVEGVLTGHSATQCTAVISTAWTEDSTHLSFGKTYFVQSSKIDSVEVVVDSGMSFVVPDPPVITSFSLPTECSSDLLDIEVSGQNLPSLETYSLTLNNTLTISIIFSDSTKGKGTMKAGLPSEVQFDTLYTVQSVKKGEDHVLLNATTFTTPLGPTLLSISTSLKSLDKKDVVLSLCGERMMLGPHKLAFVELGQSTPLSISVTINTTTSGSGSEEIYGGMTLKYGTTYEVTSLTSDTLHFSLAASITFTTDPEPARLVSFSIAGYDEKQKEVEFEMAGRVLDTSALMKVGLSISNTLKRTVWMRFNTSNGKWEGSAILFPSSAADLVYGETYTVSSFKKGEDTTELCFETNEITIDSEPSRLVTIVSEEDEGLNSITLRLSSRVLTVGEEYEMKVTGTPLSSSSNSNHEATITFTASSATENIETLSLYPFEEAIVKYGHSYCVDWMKVVGGVSILVEAESCVFETPKEPARICSCSGAVLNTGRSLVSLSLEGRALHEPLGSIWVSFEDTFWKSVSMRRISETHCEADFLVASEETETHLKYEKEYTVCLKPDEPRTLLVDSGITVRITGHPSFTEVKFEFTNTLGTGCIAILKGTNLVVGTECKVTLNTSHTFLVVVKSSTKAESSEMLIGFEGALPFCADILINSIEPTDEESGDVLIPSPFTGQTLDRQNVTQIFMDTEKGQINQTCGDSSRPCSTMDAAWKVVQTLELIHATFSLLDSTSLSSQMTIGSGMSVLIQNGTHSEPSLNIPSSAAESATSALIVVPSALLNIQNIDIVVDSSKPSFILISASSSRMILKDGLITIKSETGRSGNEMEELCLWKTGLIELIETGLIELIETGLNVTNNQFFNISQGVMRMKGGQVNIQGSIFTSNSPNHQNFPSARRNIVCSQGGTIHIGSLAAGDGTSLHPSAWISSEDCTVESAEVNAKSPFFIPTLSSDSTSKFDKKTKSFTLAIEGTILIPCSLFLKVIEIGKDGTEVNSTLIPLTQDSAASFAETRIAVTIHSSSMGSLDNSLEWRGRLVFGENQTTNNSFIVQKSSSGRLAQAVKDNMKWWIPLVVVLSCVLLALILVVVLLMRRRNSHKADKGKNNGEQQELDQTDDQIDVLKDEGNNDDNQHCLHTNGQRQLQGSPTHLEPYSQPLQNSNKVISVPAGQAAVVIVGEDQFGLPKIEDGFANAQDTLFNRLHGREGETTLNIPQTRLGLVKAIEKLLFIRPNALALRNLSPHWVLFTPSNEVCFRLNNNELSHSPATIPTQSGTQKETQEEKRWSAPEEENRENEIDEGKVTVFRLGLILWEITTGQVPFSETDAVNAQRQLGIGIVPRMDLVEPAALSTLLSECLDLNPHSRPSLESVLSRLESIDERKDQMADLLEVPNHPPDSQPESQNRNPAGPQE